jgi:hypothetical protein
MGRRARDGKSLSLQDLTDQSDYPGQERRLLRFAMDVISPSGEGRASYRLLLGMDSELFVRHRLFPARL